MKTLNQLEQEAKQAREEAIKEVSQYVPNAIEVTDTLILAAVAMVTYQFALGMEDADQIWNEQGTKVISEKIPKVSQDQKEDHADGWISWSGGSCPVNENEIVDLKFGSGHIRYGTDTKYKWEGTGARDCDIVAYRVAKAYPCKKHDDGWITWDGGKCPLPSSVKVDVQFNDCTYADSVLPTDFNWSKVAGYRISKGE